MKIQKIVRFVCFALIFSTAQFAAAAEEFTNAIRATLRDHIDLDKESVGMVVGIVDEQGSRVVSYGKIDTGDNPDVNGDTVFEIGSVTKTFTALLLQDMIERGEMRLDDPVAKYLPPSVRIPGHAGKEITLLHLATHTSGLPRDPGNLAPQRWTNPFADYTAAHLYAFLSGFTLDRDPGSKWDYSNLGVGLLGHVITLKARAEYESLVVDRICNPLGMGSTRITLTPELKSRAAIAHDWFSQPTEDLALKTLEGNGAIHSTANDMLKYVAANAGLTRTSLSPLMEKTHVLRFENFQALGWAVSGDFLTHNGGTVGSTAFAGFDRKRHRGVVVLANRGFDQKAQAMGPLLLNSEWQTGKRPAAVTLDRGIYDSLVGQYQLSPTRTVGILRDGDRLLMRETGQPLAELLPQSATTFFERLSGKPVVFTRNSRGRVYRLTLEINGTKSTFARTSGEPPKPCVAPKPPARVRADAKVSDGCLGRYKLSSGRGVTVSREGDHLLALYDGWMGFELVPSSESTFCNVMIPMEFVFSRGDGGTAFSAAVTCPLFESEFTGKATKIGE